MFSKLKNIKVNFAQLSLIICLILVSHYSFADLVFVVNPANPNAIISDADLKKIYLGKSRSFPNGDSATPLDIANGKIREEFLEKFLQKNENNLKAYWSRMIFSGKGIPPESFKTPQDLKSAVASQKNAIGFIDSSMVDESVKVITIQ